MFVFYQFYRRHDSQWDLSTEKVSARCPYLHIRLDFDSTFNWKDFEIIEVCEYLDSQDKDAGDCCSREATCALM